jgi:hypothetical protein
MKEAIVVVSDAMTLIFQYIPNNVVFGSSLILVVMLIDPFS